MNKKHRYIRVNYDDYSKYLKENHHNRLDRWNRIWAPEKSDLLKRNSVINEEEIFEGIETEYDRKNDNYTNDILITFKTNSDTEYRFDLMYEYSRKQKSPIYHLAFSLAERENYSDDYEFLTNKKESLEVLNRLIWILKDVAKTLPPHHEYCIGLTEDERKNKIYQYIIRGIRNWEKREDSSYETGWGIFFKIQ